MTETQLFGLKGKMAAVIGAGSGIGEAVAIGCARQGATVRCLDVDAEAAARTAEVMVGDGGASDAARLDITDGAAVDQAVHDTVLGEVHSERDLLADPRQSLVDLLGGRSHGGGEERGAGLEHARRHRAELDGHAALTEFCGKLEGEMLALVESGVIEQFTAVINPDKLGKGISTFVDLTVAPSAIERIAEELSVRPPEHRRERRWARVGSRHSQNGLDFHDAADGLVKLQGLPVFRLPFCS